MKDVEIKTAELIHINAIFQALQEVADEIPTRIDSEQRLASITETIRNCVASNHSLIACASTGEIAGFILITFDEVEKFLRNKPVLELRYGGIISKFRNHGIFARMLQRVIAYNYKITAEVSKLNQTKIRNILSGHGFITHEEKINYDKFIWNPRQQEGKTTTPSP
jgi:hypothetical protein